jgi:hypothetical protein
MPRKPVPTSPNRSEYPHPERVAKLLASRPSKSRPSAAAPAGPFAALPWAQQRAAERWFWKFCQRWGNDLPPWRRAILIGVARRLALHPPAANFGYSLFGAWGGKTRAEYCRREGIPHPGIAAMNRMNAWKRAGRPALPSGQLPV